MNKTPSMHTMSKKTAAPSLCMSLCLGTVLLLSPLAAAAQTSPPDSTAQAASAMTGEWVAAELRRVDLAGRKLTLKHAEIKHLDMPGMTMVFGLKDGAATPEMLASLKPGDKLQIQVQMLDGKAVVSALKR